MKAFDLASEASVSIKAGGKLCDEYLVTRDSTELRAWIVANEDDVIRVEYSFTPGSFLWQIDLVIDGILVETKTYKSSKSSSISNFFETCIWREGDDTQAHTVGMKFTLNRGQSSCIARVG